MSPFGEQNSLPQPLTNGHDSKSPTAGRQVDSSILSHLRAVTVNSDSPSPFENPLTSGTYSVVDTGAPSGG